MSNDNLPAGEANREQSAPAGTVPKSAQEAWSDYNTIVYDGLAEGDHESDFLCGFISGLAYSRDVIEQAAEIEATHISASINESVPKDASDGSQAALPEAKE